MDPLESNRLNKKNDVPQSKIELKTELQADAAWDTLHRTISMWSLYTPPHDQIELDKLEDLIKQLAKPFIPVGDFNSYNAIWGSQDINKKGKLRKSSLLIMREQWHTSIQQLEDCQQLT